MTTKQQITIALHDGPLVVEADVIGDWALHRGVGWSGDDIGYWVATHVPTGFCVHSRSGRIYDHESGLHLVRELAARVPPFTSPELTAGQRRDICAVIDEWRRRERR